MTTSKDSDEMKAIDRITMEDLTKAVRGLVESIDESNGYVRQPDEESGGDSQVDKLKLQLHLAREENKVMRDVIVQHEIDEKRASDESEALAMELHERKCQAEAWRTEAEKQDVAIDESEKRMAEERKAHQVTLDECAGKRQVIIDQGQRIDELKADLQNFKSVDAWDEPARGDVEDAIRKAQRAEMPFFASKYLVRAASKRAVQAEAECEELREEGSMALLRVDQLERHLRDTRARWDAERDRHNLACEEVKTVKEAFDSAITVNADLGLDLLDKDQRISELSYELKKLKAELSKAASTLADSSSALLDMESKRHRIGELTEALSRSVDKTFELKAKVSNLEAGQRLTSKELNTALDKVEELAVERVKFKALFDATEKCRAGEAEKVERLRVMHGEAQERADGEARRAVEADEGRAAGKVLIKLLESEVNQYRRQGGVSCLKVKEERIAQLENEALKARTALANVKSFAEAETRRISALAERNESLQDLLDSLLCPKHLAQPVTTNDCYLCVIGDVRHALDKDV